LYPMRMIDLATLSFTDYDDGEDPEADENAEDGSEPDHHEPEPAL